MRLREVVCAAAALWTRPSIQDWVPPSGEAIPVSPPWQIDSTSLEQGTYQSRMTLANGYIGINLGALGPFFEKDGPAWGKNPGLRDPINGWPLNNERQTFASIAGFYDADDVDGGTNYPWLQQYGGDSFLSGIPHWSGLLVKVDGE